MRSIKLFIMLLAFASLLHAQTSPFNSQTKVPKDPVKEFQFISYFYSHAMTNNVYPALPLRGQLVGRFFAGNNPTRTGKTSQYFEQRLIPFFIYQPKLLDGKAILRASFEIDWVWGDANYSTGGNVGSAFNADAVNIQTQNIELELIPAKGWAVNLGLQRVFDTPYNPYRTFFNTMTYTGYRLAFWGSDGVGISVRHDMDFQRYKMGYYQLFENDDEKPDDIALWELMYEKDITPTWRQGLSLWYVSDGGAGNTVYGLNGLYSGLNGQYVFPLPDYNANLFWAGTFGAHNAEFNLGRWMTTGFGLVNFGKVTSSSHKDISVFGFAGNLRAGYKYGQTAEDIVTADLLFVTGDKDSNKINDNKYNGIITGNSYGLPGAIFISSGAYLVFPHGNVVNRYVAAVTDLSNLGYGIAGGTLNFHRGLIPNKLNAKVGVAGSYSHTKPYGGGRLIGTEINGRLSYNLKVFMNLELHAAYMWLGSFYDSPLTNGNQTAKLKNPWTTFVVYKWLMF